MKKLVTILSAIALLSSCNEESTPVVPEDTSSHDLQVSLYGLPVVTIEKEQYPGGPVTEVELDYNRQVYIDLDAASADTNADTTGIHWNDAGYVQFDIPGGVDTAEGSEGWDIVMTYYNGYTSDGEGGQVPYYMTGGLVNKGTAKALRLNKAELEEEGQTFVAYNDVTFEDASALTLSSSADAIGSDWKALDFETFTYKIVEDQYYIVESSEGKLYKLTFTDFYSEEDGTKGFPKFKFQRLIAE
ncbi:HmuY family protein [Flammeovirga agarivorans]|uniref:HmuY protein n=1 Tax=Flammeovirga agarivorans TaxID=2726742 RepID=A0A7X8SGM5_9BACT|nr:HmuY family protein [Flammeovirga agarivorans]NLR89860.1 hypothetical protein [Flammeovirga agarivorans]